MKKALKEKLERYMQQKYRVEIEPIPEEDGGGFEACIPQLGRWTLCCDGDTESEALERLEEVKRSYFTIWLEEGKEIPLPDTKRYSGRFVLRTSSDLHRQLSEHARESGVSLNAYANQALAAGLPVLAGLPGEEKTAR